ncbi:MAG: YicC family protein [Nitrospirota bacterium]
MTGFGSAEDGGFRVEIRSLNHRFMDISLKMPPVLGRHEMKLRSALQQKFDRGKFDVYVSAAGAGKLKLKPNAEIAREVRRALVDLQEEVGVEGRVDLGMLLHWRDVFLNEEVEYDEAALFGAFERAVAGLEEMRAKEGDALSAEIAMRADSLARLNDEVVSIAPRAMEAAKARLFERLREMFADRGCEDSRLMQEAAGAAERADITEETTRIANHIAHMRDILEKGGAVGRKLDFLFQELNREANTIASKTDDYRIAEIVIEMKAEIEKAREQAQNIQ